MKITMRSIDDVEGEVTTYANLLHALASERVFEIERKEDGTFVVEENCDNYFNVPLTREQLRALGEEIIAVADGGETVSQWGSPSNRIPVQ